MAKSVKASPTSSPPAWKPRASLTATPPATLQERQQRIEAMGKRIDGYVHFICELSGSNGASNEAKEKAVAAFYERMVLVEHQLGRIHDELRLA